MGDPRLGSQLADCAHGSPAPSADPRRCGRGAAVGHDRGGPLASAQGCTYWMRGCLLPVASRIVPTHAAMSKVNSDCDLLRRIASIIPAKINVCALEERLSSPRFWARSLWPASLYRTGLSSAQEPLLEADALYVLAMARLWKPPAATRILSAHHNQRSDPRPDALACCLFLTRSTLLCGLQ